MEKINLAKIEERLKNLIERNSAEHKDISDKIQNLISHVNDQLEMHDARIIKLEDEQLVQNSKWKGLKELFKWSSLVAASILSLLALISYLKGLGVI